MDPKPKEPPKPEVPSKAEDPPKNDEQDDQDALDSLASEAKEFEKASPPALLCCSARPGAAFRDGARVC